MSPLSCTSLPMILTALLASCAPQPVLVVTVLCDDPAGVCTDAAALTAFQGATSRPGSSLRLVWLGEGGASVDAAICVPARYTDGAVRGPALLAEAARALLAGPHEQSLDAAVCPGADLAACPPVVPPAFACDDAAGSADIESLKVTVGPIASFRLEASVAQPSTAYVLICDQSGSTAARSCDPASAVRTLFERFVQDGAPPASRVIVVPTRDSYGATLDTFVADVRPHGEPELRILEMHRTLSAASAWLAQHAGTGSAILEAIAVGARAAQQGRAERIDLAVWSDGRQVSGRIDLTRRLDQRTLRSFEALAHAALPEESLAGAVVRWHGLHGHGSTVREHRALRSVIGDVLTHAGASSVAFEDLVAPEAP